MSAPTSQPTVLSNLNAAIGLISTTTPILFAAYNAYRAIWAISNPGKSEADYVAHLGEASQRTTADADAVLLSLGYIQDGQGNWSLPAAVPPLAVAPPI